MTRYVIRSRKTGKTYYRTDNGYGITDWCYLGEEETHFPSMTEAVLFAEQRGVRDYEAVPVNDSTAK